MNVEELKPKLCEHDLNEFCNDLEVFCSAKEHKGMVIELMRVYGETVTLKDVLDSIYYQIDKYENRLFNHHLWKTETNLATAVMSSINDGTEPK